MKKNDPLQSLHITHYNLKPFTVLLSYYLTVLPAGFYFVRIETEK